MIGINNLVDRQGQTAGDLRLSDRQGEGPLVAPSGNAQHGHGLRASLPVPAWWRTGRQELRIYLNTWQPMCRAFGSAAELHARVVQDVAGRAMRSPSRQFTKQRHGMGLRVRGRCDGRRATRRAEQVEKTNWMRSAGFCMWS